VAKTVTRFAIYPVKIYLKISFLKIFVIIFRTTVKGTTLQHKTNVTAAPDTGIKPPKTKRRKNRRDTV
jgi:hypothetical protein